MVFLVVGAVDFLAADAFDVAGMAELPVLLSFLLTEGADGAAAVELGLAVDTLMTMVVFGFPHHAATHTRRQ
ncbi:MAG: hypothetical protein KJO21_08150 [Verrucomicrobiae bacterium]|nr:hypothetical protein [Verrucomicrobiae bacterium]NNJ43446.1 hypothetical protein [Akkermansiaceae bacterium]